MIFFAINLILEFLAITRTLAIIFATFTTIALIILLIVSIKNDVINKPQCFGGGKKSFIDLYQNEQDKKEKPELEQTNKENKYNGYDDE